MLRLPVQVLFTELPIGIISQWYWVSSAVHRLDCMSFAHMFVLALWLYMWL